MIVELAKPPGFKERRFLISGRLKRDGHPDYGAIFTTEDRPSDGSLDTTQLLGAYVENVSAEGAENRYFEILGGYFFNDRSPQRTTRVFGIALQPEFGITEGGATIINNNWKADNTRNRDFAEATHGSGWTFIVAHHDLPTEKFPHSDNPLRIVLVCPSIKSFTATVGDCEQDPDTQRLRRRVNFASEIEDPAPLDWQLDFGDGETMAGDGMPPERVSHFYDRRPAKAPVLRLQGRDRRCEMSSMQAEVAEFEPCERCPEITEFRPTIGECVRHPQENRLLREVTFHVATGETEPVKWQIDFGDGESASGAGLPPQTVSHLYAGSPTFAPTLQLSGHATCDDVSKSVELPALEPCPECANITRFEHRERPRDANRGVLDFQVSYAGASPDRFEWDWGDGSPVEASNDPTRSHTFTIPPEGATYTVNVVAIGPGGCRTTQKKTITFPAIVPPLPCPKPFTWLPFLVALLLAFTGSSLLAHIAGAAYHGNLDMDSTGLITFIVAVLALVAIILWYLGAKRWPCPLPSHCDWLGIGWVVSLAAAIVAFYIRNCCGGFWLVIPLVLFLLAVYLIFTWYRRCKVARKSLILFAAACLVAIVFASLFIANPLFQALGCL